MPGVPNLQACGQRREGYFQRVMMAKVMASDTAMKVTIDAVQVMGGYGYMKEYPVER